MEPQVDGSRNLLVWKEAEIAQFFKDNFSDDSEDADV
jgi:hypothetical protein